MTSFASIMELLAAIAVSLIYIAGKWQLFKKMGQAGWKSLIPIYSEYLIFEDSWCGEMFFVSALISASCASFTELALHASHANLSLTVFAIAFGAAAFIIDIIALYKHARSFGHGIGFTMGLFFAEPLFITILGLEKSKCVK